MFNFRAYKDKHLIITITHVNVQYLPVGPQTNVPVDTVTGGDGLSVTGIYNIF
jgi:hypothetical protein